MRKSRATQDTYYIAGGMSGYADHNFPAFFAAEEFLTSRGINVISPARHDLEIYPDIQEWKTFQDGNRHEDMKQFDLYEIGGWDLDQIRDPNTTGIALLPNWEKSRGATAEHAVAIWYGKKIMFVDGGRSYFSDKPHPHPHKLVGLVGLKESGKDTAAAGLLNEGWTRVALADPVREFALAIDPQIILDSGRAVYRLANYVEQVGWDRAKKEQEVRTLLQKIGTDAVREIFGADAWTNLAERTINSTEGPCVITDIRFQTEADWVRSRGGFLVKIVRPGQKAADQHASEQEISKIMSDWIIFNDSDREVLQKRLVELVNN